MINFYYIFNLILCSESCAIPDLESEAVYLTGGGFSFYSASVTKYGVEGFLEDLPALNTGRKSHGCSGYLDTDNAWILVVVGGVSAIGEV